jgi:uncharacterized protein (TIGR02145 family)
MNMRLPLRILFSASLFFLISCKDNEVIPSSGVLIEGKQYSVVKIGAQTWTTTNYEGPGGVYYDAAQTKAEYGKYYSKAELSNITLPEGWRIPTQEDYKKLAEFYGLTVPTKIADTEAVKKLISTTRWNHVTGTNVSGFNAYPGGYIFGAGIPMDGDIAEFWTVEGYSFSIQEAGENLSSLRIALYDSNNSPDFKFNLRLVKDGE